MKKSVIYLTIIFLWVFLLAIAYNSLIEPTIQAQERGSLIVGLTILNVLFISYFWLNGLKDIAYTIAYYIIGKRNNSKQLDEKKMHMHMHDNPYIEMLYCTYNDFSETSLNKSIFQDYTNYSVVILDDSNQAQYIQEIDNYVAKHRQLHPHIPMKVVRRDNNIGYKAGNLNNHLKDSTCDYFVILDSDEVIPPDFNTLCLKHFYKEPTTGIVQANHIATNNQNSFMELFAMGVDSHWITYQTVKDRYGFLSLLGHGAMVKKECYDEVGGFPHLVAEDLCFSIEIRNKGYFVRFAPEIVCHEEYPISYVAFKKRHNKWTQGNMEFIKKYSWRIITSKMSWFEKLDIFLFTYSLPLTFVFSLYLINNLIVLPLLGYDPIYDIYLLIPTVLFLFAPVFNDVFFYIKDHGPFRIAFYLVHTIMLYGSMFYVSLEASLKSVFGKAVFLVTPKTAENISFINAVTFNWKEIVFGVVLLTLSWSVYLTMKSNKPKSYVQIRKNAGAGTR
jgi:cellulose synthase/poly-beta-1,6-N-acetylglucosamine synthase-like glycosyltransferase